MKHPLNKLLFLVGLTWLCSACLNAPAPHQEQKTEPSTADVLDSALETITEKDVDGNIIEFTRRDSDDVREGVFTKKNLSGITLESANYHNGKLDGHRVLFYPSGDSLILETYREGVFDGVYKAFHPNGKLKTQGMYRNNEIEGLWLQYYDTGQLKEEVRFENGEENGPFKEYHPNGKLSVEGQYKDGDNENGPLKMYDENGQHFKTMDCKMGICRTVWSIEPGKESKSKSKKRKQQ